MPTAADLDHQGAYDALLRVDEVQGAMKKLRAPGLQPALPTLLAVVTAAVAVMLASAEDVSPTASIIYVVVGAVPTAGFAFWALVLARRERRAQLAEPARRPKPEPLALEKAGSLPDDRAAIDVASALAVVDAASTTILTRITGHDGAVLAAATDALVADGSAERRSADVPTYALTGLGRDRVEAWIEDVGARLSEFERYRG